MQLPQPLLVAALLPLGTHDTKMPRLQLVVTDVQPESLEAVHTEESGEEVVEVFVRFLSQFIPTEVQHVHHHIPEVEEEVECYSEVLQYTVLSQIALCNTEDLQVAFHQEDL